MDVLGESARSLLLLGALYPEFRANLCSRPELASISAMKREMEWLLAGQARDTTKLREKLPSYAELLTLIERRDAAVELGPNRAAPAFENLQVQLREVLGSLCKNRIRLIPFAVELTDGCTVGCWYCGVNAREFVAPPPRIDLVLLAEVLAVCRSYFGQDAVQGTLYMATEPFDSPDYEQCCRTFADVTGSWPFLSTAMGAQQPDRFREHLLEISRRNGRGARVTVNSVGALRRLHEAFSDRELLFTNVHVRSPRSLSPLALVGRARQAALKSRSLRVSQAQVRAEIYGLADDGGEETIWCLFGPRINLARGTVEFCIPSAGASNGIGMHVVEHLSLDPRAIEESIARHYFT